MTRYSAALKRRECVCPVVNPEGILVYEDTDHAMLFAEFGCPVHGSSVSIAIRQLGILLYRAGADTVLSRE